MINQENISLDDQLDVNSIRESSYAKFTTLGKEHFRAEDPLEITNVVKELAQFYKFQLPQELNEIFIKFEEAPLFWISGSSTIKKLEDNFKLNHPRKLVLDYFRFIKEFYLKWAIIQSESEKKYFAASALNFINKDANKDVILNIFLHATILIYERSLFNPQKALKLLNNARTSLENIIIDETVKKELYYLISLYEAFASLALKQIEDARFSFESASNNFPAGITAKFYLALTELMLNNVTFSEVLVKEIFEYDKKRLEFALDNKNLKMFSYLLNHNITYNLFYYYEFSRHLNVFEEMIELFFNAGRFTIESLKDKIKIFKEAKVKEYYTEEMTVYILFIEQFLQKYLQSKNLLLLLVCAEKLDVIFSDIVSELKAAIKNRFRIELDDKIKIFDDKIKTFHQVIERIKKEIEANKNSAKENLKKAIEKVEKHITFNIKAIEYRLDNLDKQGNLNPENAFKNAMIYTIIVTFLVFMVGGFAGYSNSYSINIYNLKSVLSVIITSGAKWGAVSFLIGIIVSFMAAGSVLVERSNQRQNLVKAISSLKNTKQKEIDRIKKDSQAREKGTINTLESSIKEQEKRIEEVNEEKSFQLVNLKKENDEQMNKELSKIKLLLRLSNLD